MFNWIKNILGLTSGAVSNAFELTVDLAVDVAEQAADTVGVVTMETKESLSGMTKTAIDSLAKERFGIDLDRRKNKDSLIEDFLKAQEQY